MEPYEMFFLFLICFLIHVKCGVSRNARFFYIIEGRETKVLSCYRQAIYERHQEVVSTKISTVKAPVKRMIREQMRVSYAISLAGHRDVRCYLDCVISDIINFLHPNTISLEDCVCYRHVAIYGALIHFTDHEHHILPSSKANK